MIKLRSIKGKLILVEQGRTARLGNLAMGIDNEDAVNVAQLNAALASAGSVSDTAYNATSWDAVTTVAPSKNAVRDKFEAMDLLIMHLAGIETITGLKTYTSLLTASGRLGLPTGDANNKAIFFGGAGTGIWRDTGYDGLKILINNVNAFWLGDSNNGIVSKLQFTTESMFINGGTPQTLTGAGAIDLSTYTTLIVTTGANALTLAAGVEGQHKFIRMKTDGGDGTLTVTNLQGGTTITFNDAGDFVKLFYVDAKWHIEMNSGCSVA